jgi:hypothetical protein
MAVILSSTLRGFVRSAPGIRFTPQLFLLRQHVAEKQPQSLDSRPFRSEAVTNPLSLPNVGDQLRAPQACEVT